MIKNLYSGSGIVVQWIKPPFGVLVIHRGMPIEVQAAPGRRWMMAQVLGSLRLIWETQAEFLVPAFDGPSEPWLMQHLLASLPDSPAFQINRINDALLKVAP